MAKASFESFESIRQRSDALNDCWSSRDLARVLGYDAYRNFIQVLNKAMHACFGSGQPVGDHFVDVDNMVPIGSGAQRSVRSTLLSRYACYLVIQNADPEKPLVALGQTYFAVQTRRQELAGLGDAEGELRLHLRDELKTHNTRLAQAARLAGVDDPLAYAVFQDHGYRGLYGGQGQADIHRRKGLKKSQRILDHMGSTELAANLFRATQTRDKLRRENVKGSDAANRTHFEVGQKVRKTIQDLGGQMPETLPNVENIKKVTAKKVKRLRER